MSKRIRLTESDLHRDVKESVSKIINESQYQEMPNKLSMKFKNRF